MRVQAQRMIGAFTLALSVAVLLVGPAQANRPDNRPGTLGIGSQGAAAPNTFELAVARAPGAQVARPNDRAGLLGVGAAETSTQTAVPDDFERAVLHHTTALRPDDRAGLHGVGIAVADPAPVATTASNGFQWAAAGFGAAAALGLVLVGVAAAVAVHHRGRAIPN